MNEIKWLDGGQSYPGVALPVNYDLHLLHCFKKIITDANYKVCRNAFIESESQEMLNYDQIYAYLLQS